MLRLRQTVPPAALAVFLAFALTACVGSSPAPVATTAPASTPIASEAPSPTPTAAPLTIVVDGDSVDVVRAGGEKVASVPYSLDAVTASSTLSAAIKETPVGTTDTSSTCNPQLNVSSFGGLHLYSSPDGVNKPQNAQFYVVVDGAATLTGVPITMPSGQSVGASAGEVLTANDKAPSFNNGSSIDLHYDIKSGTADGPADQYYGAYAQLAGGKLTELISPEYYLFDC